MLDIKKLVLLQPELEEKSKQEFFKELPKALIDFVISDVIKENLIIDRARKNFDASPRVLNNWKNNGLLPGKLKEGEWHKFNKIESIWLMLIEELRAFGLSLDAIGLVKNKILNSKVKGFSPLEFAVMRSIVQEPMNLLVLQNGESYLMTREQYVKYLEDEFLPPHISISILSLSKKEFPQNVFDTIEPNRKAVLTEKELQLLYFIRTGEFDSIKIVMKEGEIYLIESQSKIPLNKKLIDIIKQASYQNIEIKTDKGKIVHISSTHKTKLK